MYIYIYHYINISLYINIYIYICIIIYNYVCIYIYWLLSMHVHTYWAAQPPRIITQAGNLETAKKGKSWIGSFWAPILRPILMGFIVRKMGRAITYAYIYIYTPGPQRPWFLKFWPIKSGGKPTKIEVIWVPGIDMICVYTNYVCCYHVHPVIHWVLHCSLPRCPV